MAILAALEIIEDRNWSRAVVFSDSRSVLNAIGAPYDHYHSSHLILKMKQRLYNLIKVEDKDIKLIWIPGHADIEGNERADYLPRETIRDGRDTQYDILIPEFTNLWKSQMYEGLFDWVKKESRVRESLYCRQFLEEKRQIWFNKFDLKRKVISTVNRLRSGHTSLSGSLHRFNIVESPMCLKCNVEETPNYVFWECIGFEKQREKLWIALIKAQGCFPHYIEYLLATLDYDIVYDIERFICSINKFI